VFNTLQEAAKRSSACSTSAFHLLWVAQLYGMLTQ